MTRLSSCLVACGHLRPMPGVLGSVNLSDQEGTEAPAAQIDGCALCLGSANKLLLELSEV